MGTYSAGPEKEYSQTIAEVAMPKAYRPVEDGPHTALRVAAVRALTLKNYLFNYGEIEKGQMQNQVFK